MTNDEMATLDALAAAATPGPWRVKPLKGKYYGTDVQIGTHGQISLWRTGGYDDPMERVPSQEECPGWTPDWRDEDGDPYCLADNHYQSQRDADTAAFIAAARDAVPALVATVRDRDAEVTRLREIEALTRQWFANGQQADATKLALIRALDGGGA